MFFHEWLHSLLRKFNYSVTNKEVKKHAKINFLLQIINLNMVRSTDIYIHFTEKKKKSSRSIEIPFYN
ncbi:hypothetical protein PGB90_006832 [Kerria lacca]